MRDSRWLATAEQVGQVAQLVEQRIENPRVGSSILPLATTKNKTVARALRFFAFSVAIAVYKQFLSCLAASPVKRLLRGKGLMRFKP